MLASTPGPIYLAGLTPEILSTIITFMYLGRCVVEDKNVTAVLNAAKKFGIKELCDLTEEKVFTSNNAEIQDKVRKICHFVVFTQN